MRINRGYIIDKLKKITNKEDLKCKF